jgi:restriction endonuclease S subunit
MLSELRNENKTFRIDSEYLKKEYLKNIFELKNYSNGFIRLSEAISYMSGGATPLGAEYQEKGIPFLRVQNIMQNYFNLNDVVYLTKQQDEEIKRSRLKENDVLLTITGVSYGKSAVVPESLINANINQHSVKITLNSKLNPFFLSTFFNAKQGKLQSDKNVVGVTRPALDYDVIRNFVIPTVSNDFQLSVEQKLKESENLTKQSQILYYQAEELLLKSIELKDFQPTQENKSVKSFSESFLATGRLDAEYYQPKYEEIIVSVKAYKSGFSNLSKFIDSYSTGYPYKSETYIENNGIPLVRINNLTKEGLNLSNAIHIPKEDLSLSIKDIAKENDILVSMSGTIGLSCVVKEKEQIVINQRIMKISSKNYNPHILSMLLNSIVGKYQLERIGTGGVQTNISSTDIKNIVIPIIDKESQQQIAELIEKSSYLCEESKRLLNEAKDMVEKEIGKEKEN